MEASCDLTFLLGRLRKVVLALRGALGPGDRGLQPVTFQPGSPSASAPPRPPKGDGSTNVSPRCRALSCVGVMHVLTFSPLRLIGWPAALCSSRWCWGMAGGGPHFYQGEGSGLW